MRTFAGVLIGKIVAYLISLLRLGGGSAAPGLYALKIDHQLVEKLSNKIPKNIIITGTNGKTTTARLLAHFAQKEGLKVIRNHTGSNLERGIASTLIQNWGGNFDMGIWELDEAAFNNVAPKISPDIIVFLNVFRDQLDRYGEIDTVVKNWCQTLSKITSSIKIIINGDDANTAKLAKCFKGQVQKFGVKDYKITGESLEKLKEKEDFDFEAKSVKLNGLKGSEFSLIINHKSFIINLPLPGIYHIYDTLAAVGIGLNLGFNPRNMLESLKTFSPAFGRVEKLSFGYIFLIKNPAGATQVFQTLAPSIKPNDRLLLALNDNIADGKDVSWIWDIDLEKFKVQTAKCKIICSGTRAYDLALRLKYANFSPSVEPGLEKALKQARSGLKGQLFILPTYTAMLKLQLILAKQGIKKKYWETE